MTRLAKFITRLVNLNSNEILPVFVSWVLSFLVRFGVVIGFTLLTVYFTVNYGIYSLAALFIIHSLGIILGSAVFGEFVNKVKKEYMIIGLSLVASILVLFGAHFYYVNELYFLICSFAALSVLVGQLKIVRMVFTEEMFTPSQSHRTFPVIESAETIGIILGGLMFTVFASSLDLHKFMYFWSISLLLIVPIVFWYLSVSISIPFQEIVNPHQVENHTKSRIGRIKNVFGSIRGSKFIISLVVVMFLQWSFVSVLEFQYTKSLKDALHPPTDSHAVHETDSKTNVVKTESASKPEEHFENDFAKELGSIQAGIGFFALFFQLFLASRIISFLGITGSLLVYPIVLFASLISMLLNFGVVSSVTTKFNQELATVLHYNAYHSSYYVVRHHYRGVVAEFIEGFIRPFGAIIGTLFVVLAGYIGHLIKPDKFLTIVSMCLVGLMFFATIKLKDYYEDSPRNDLLHSDSITDMINAIEIMEQNGSIDDARFLVGLINSRDDLPSPVLDKIFKFLGEVGDIDVLSDVLIYVENSEVSLSSLDCLNSIFIREFTELKKKPFTWHGLKKLYSKLLNEVKDPRMKANLLSFMVISNYNEGMIDEVINILNQEIDEATLEVCIEILQKTNDKYLLKLISPYFNTNYCSKSVFALNKANLTESDYSEFIVNIVNSNSKPKILSLLTYVVGTDQSGVYDTHISKLKISHLKDSEIQFVFNCHNAKMNLSKDYYSIFEKMSVTEMLSIAWLVESMDEAVINKAFKKRVEFLIHELFEKISEKDSVKEASEDLVLLQKLYSLLGAEREYYIVKEYLSLSVA